MMTGGQFPGGPPPGSFNSPSPSMVNEQNSSPMDIGVSPDSMEPPPEPADPNPNFLFNCCVCRQFGSDSLDHLSQHLTQDRTKIREHEVSIVIAGNFICKLCSYKTNLKANFQLHCKTDKHLQRLNHVNHIKEGGMANEWKLKFLNVTNPVQLRCNSCDYYTNSLHKLQLHVANQRHEISTILFAHLKKSEMSVPDDRRKSYNCCLCKFTSSGKLLLMAHVRSMKHLQMEQIHQLQKRSEGNATQTEIGDIFQVVDRDANEEERASSNTSAADQEKTNNESGKKFNFETLVHHFDGCDLRSSFHGFAQKSCFVWLL
jgi:AT-binding transcription factor 1